MDPQAPRSGALVLAALPALALLAVTTNDFQWSVALMQLRLDGFVGFMDQSLFEGEPPGASDLAVFVYLAGLAAYAASFAMPQGPRQAQARISGAFLVAVGILVGFLLVHVTKGVIGRPRPNDVVPAQAMAHFVAWYEFGADYLGGWGKGSFISGHTTLIGSLLAVVLCIAAWPADPARRRRRAFVGAGLVVVAAAAMGFARVVRGDHWLSDVLGALVLTWLAVTWLFTWAFQVPRYFAAIRAGQLPSRSLPRMWELAMTGWLVVAVVAVVIALYGLRALLESSALVGLSMLAASAAALATSCYRAGRLHQTVRRCLAMRRSDPTVPPDPAAGGA